MGRTHSRQIPVGSEGVTPLVSFLNRWRITAGLVILGYCVAEGVVEREAPYDLLLLNEPVVAGLMLILAGVAVRLWALGTIEKNRSLTTTGIYSLCRHPLYAGSALLAVGFGVLMNDAEFLYLGIPYAVLFFGAAAFAEEHFLKRKFGVEFDYYRHMVPGFVPLGHWRPGDFSWRRAMRKGGRELILAVLLLLVGIEVMARMFGP